VLICPGFFQFDWDTPGKFALVSFKNQTRYALPLTQQFDLPKLPSAGVSRVEDFPTAKTAIAILNFVEAAISPSFYACTRQNTRRHLYRIQLQ
jgi:hypothetical protein